MTTLEEKLSKAIRDNAGYVSVHRTLKAVLAVLMDSKDMTQAAQDVLAERRRQIEAEGYSPDGDDEYECTELADAAACYAANAGGIVWDSLTPQLWPFSAASWKPLTPREDLVRAGALILAEIERLDRKGANNGSHRSSKSL